MKIESDRISVDYIPLAEIIPYNNNPRKNEKAVEVVAKSIKEFGFKNPIILDKNNEIIAGHTRLKAAEKLGMTEVPVIWADNLTPEQVKAFRIADNKTAEIAEWDHDLLKQELLNLEELEYDMETLGFPSEELGDIMGGGEIKTEEDNFEPPKTAKYEVKEGDVWQLGNHRLMCGDSTNEEHVKTLMSGEKADMVFTDPPDNINYKDLKGKHEEITNDSMSEEEFAKFLEKTIKLFKSPRGYICCNWKYYGTFYKIMSFLGIPCKACIVWDKEHGVQNLDKYHKQHEFILYYGEFGGEKTLRGDIYRLQREKSELHPTMKPLELCTTFIQDSSKKEDTVYDAFGGSGSTLIACEQTSRKCFMMELDPYYCSVIIERWEALTNKKAEKIQ